MIALDVEDYVATQQLADTVFSLAIKQKKFAYEILFKCEEEIQQISNELFTIHLGELHGRTDGR